MNNKFMRLVANALYIIIKMQLGYKMSENFVVWKDYYDEFLDELNKEGDI